ncbi:MAG: hypothetical protein WC652_06595, partial [archaeon]
MNDNFWIGVDINSPQMEKILDKSPKIIKKHLLQGTAWPLPSQKCLQNELNTDKLGLELIEYAKLNNKPALLELLLITRMCKKKGADLFVKLIQSKKYLTEVEIENCKKEIEYDRVALAYKVFKKNSEYVKDLYWSYLAYKREFTEYYLSKGDGKHLFKLLPNEVNLFESRIPIALSEKCSCWHIMINPDEKIYCLRGFPTEKILHQLRENKPMKLAKTHIFKISTNGIIKIPGEAKLKTMTMVKELAKDLLKEKKESIERHFAESKKDTLEKIRELLINPETIGNVIITEIKFSQTSIPGNPAVQLTKNSGLNKTFENIEKTGINIKEDYKKIVSITLLVDEKYRTVKIRQNKDFLVFCSSSMFISEENKQ